MWHTLQTDDLAKVGQVFEHCGHAAIVSFEEDLQGQTGEQLRLGELLGAEPVGVRRK
ncbi:MAG: hypothetical protein SVT52_00240 [Planctomycetota bacterium]|nr:hypothetical protein [Planctomycetota bacterium]